MIECNGEVVNRPLVTSHEAVRVNFSLPLQSSSPPFSQRVSARMLHLDALIRDCFNVA